MMKRFKEILIWIGIVAVVILFAVASRPFRPSGDSLADQSAANFTLPNLAGEQVEFDKLRQGKRVLLFFWATWCPHCQNKIAELPRITKQLAEKNVELLLINVGEPAEKAKQYLSGIGTNTDTLLDQQSNVSYAYQGVGLPWFVLVDEKGMIQGADFDVPDL